MRSNASRVLFDGARALLGPRRARRRRSPTTARVSAWISSISPAISRAAPPAFSARRRTSSATTAKPRAVLAGASGLDRGVERQQVRLLGDLGDALDDRADLGRLAFERADRDGGRPRGVADGGHRRPTRGTTAATPSRASSRASRAALGRLTGRVGGRVDGVRHLARGQGGDADHPQLVLGAAGDLGHRERDLGHRAPGLVGGARRRCPDESLTVVAVATTSPIILRRLTVMRLEGDARARRARTSARRRRVRSPPAIRSPARSISRR